jgi:hypothetical protein
MADTPLAQQPALVPVYKTIITWKDGQPVMAAEPVLTQHHVRSLYLIAAAQPYEVTDPLDPDFGLYDGMTIAEVMVRKQLIAAARSGDVEAAMDRLIGRPMARGEQVNVNLDGSYEGYLKGLAAKMAPGAAGGPIEAEVIEPSVFGDLA